MEGASTARGGLKQEKRCTQQKRCIGSMPRVTLQIRDVELRISYEAYPNRLVSKLRARHGISANARKSHHQRPMLSLRVRALRAGA